MEMKMQPTISRQWAEGEKNYLWDKLEGLRTLQNICDMWGKHRDFWTHDELNDNLNQLDAKESENKLIKRDEIDHDGSNIDIDEIDSKAKKLSIKDGTSENSKVYGSTNNDVTSPPQDNTESATTRPRLISRGGNVEMADGEGVWKGLRVQREERRFARFVWEVMKSTFWKMKEQIWYGLGVTDVGNGILSAVCNVSIQENQRTWKKAAIGHVGYVPRRWSNKEVNSLMIGSRILREIWRRS